MSNISAHEHYEAAGKRHRDDGVFLHDDRRLANADHLYGLAVECMLKGLLLRCVPEVSMSRPSPSVGKPQWKGPGARSSKGLGHLPELWTEVGGRLRGRTGSQLFGLLDNSEPFMQWNVADRYCDGQSVTEVDVQARRHATDQILALVQQAILGGTLP